MRELFYMQDCFLLIKLISRKTTKSYANFSVFSRVPAQLPNQNENELQALKIALEEKEQALLSSQETVQVGNSFCSRKTMIVFQITFHCSP